MISYYFTFSFDLTTTSQPTVYSHRIRAVVEHVSNNYFTQTPIIIYRIPCFVAAELLMKNEWPVFTSLANIINREFVSVNNSNLEVFLGPRYQKLNRVRGVH